MIAKCAVCGEWVNISELTFVDGLDRCPYCLEDYQDEQRVG